VTATMRNGSYPMLVHNRGGDILVDNQRGNLIITGTVGYL
jgi:hypothetical protein